MTWTATDPGAAAFDPAVAEELVSRLRLAVSRLETSIAGRSSRAENARDAWRGLRRERSTPSSTR